MQRVGVKGIHIAERDTQRASTPKPRGKFINTWSVEGFISEGLQPSELGWGTHEKTMPPGAHRHDFGCDAAIYLTRPGAGTRVRSWTPTAQAQHAWMITHNELISIADYFTLRENGKVVYRPTCHYAYHPAMTPCCRCTRWRARSGSRRRPGTSSPRTTSSTASTNSACCSTASQERLLVRLAALDRGDPQARALSERNRAAGDLGRARRHRLDAGEPGLRHRRSRRDGFPPLPRNPAALSGAGDRSLHGLDPVEGRRRLFPETVDRDDPWQFSNVLVS